MIISLTTINYLGSILCPTSTRLSFFKRSSAVTYQRGFSGFSLWAADHGDIYIHPVPPQQKFDFPILFGEASFANDAIHRLYDAREMRLIMMLKKIIGPLILMNLILEELVRPRNGYCLSIWWRRNVEGSIILMIRSLDNLDALKEGKHNMHAYIYIYIYTTRYITFPAIVICVFEFARDGSQDFRHDLLSTYVKKIPKTRDKQIVVRLHIRIKSFSVKTS
jgi:hypothetical protein